MFAGYSRKHYKQREIEEPIIDLFCKYYRYLPYTLDDIRSAKQYESFTSPAFEALGSFWTLQLLPNYDGKDEFLVRLHHGSEYIKDNFNLSIHYCISIKEIDFKFSVNDNFNNKHASSTWPKKAVVLSQFKSADSITIKCELSAISDCKEIAYHIPNAIYDVKFNKKEVAQLKNKNYFKIEGPIFEMGNFKWHLSLQRGQRLNDTKLGITLVNKPKTASKILAGITVNLRQIPRHRFGVVYFTNNEPTFYFRLLQDTWPLIYPLNEILTQIQITYFKIFNNDEKEIMHDRTESVTIDPSPISNYEWKLPSLNETNIDNVSSPIFELQGFKWSLQCVTNIDDVKLMLILIEKPAGISMVKIRRELYLKEANISEFQMVEYKDMDQNTKNKQWMNGQLSKHDIQDLKSLTFGVNLSVVYYDGDDAKVENDMFNIGRVEEELADVMSANDKFEWISSRLKDIANNPAGLSKEEQLKFILNDIKSLDNAVTWF